MHFSTIVRRSFTATMFSLALASCARGSEPALGEDEPARVPSGDPSGGIDQSPTVSTPQRGVPAFDGPEVATIVVMLEQNEVERAQLGFMRASSPEVKAYAKAVWDVHAAFVARFQGYAMRYRTQVIKELVTAEELRREAHLSLKDLDTRDVSEFDVAYMTSQISGHAKLLGIIDQTLAASAFMTLARASGEHDPDAPTRITLARELETAVRTWRASVAEQTARALEIQNRLRGGRPIPELVH